MVYQHTVLSSLKYDANYHFLLKKKTNDLRKVTFFIWFKRCKPFVTVHKCTPIFKMINLKHPTTKLHIDLVTVPLEERKKNQFCFGSGLCQSGISKDPGTNLQ